VIRWQAKSFVGDVFRFFSESVSVLIVLSGFPLEWKCLKKLNGFDFMSVHLPPALTGSFL